MQDWELRYHMYEVYDDGQIVDTLRVPEYAGLDRTGSAFFRTSARGGRIVRGLSAAPFSPVPAWDITERGTVIGGTGDDYVLVETDLYGDTLRTIRRDDVVRRTVPAAEARDSAAALAARIDSLPVPLDRVQNLAPEIRDGIAIETLPSFIAVHVATEGRLWVERWPAEGRGDERFFDVFDSDAQFERVVVVPTPLVRDPPPYIMGDAIYGVVRDPETEVERVVVVEF